MNGQIVADWLRALNAIMGLLAFVLLFARTASVWRHWSYSQKMVFSALALYLLGNMYGSIELLLARDSFSLRVVPFFIGHALLLAYLAEPERRYRARLGIDLRTNTNETDSSD